MSCDRSALYGSLCYQAVEIFSAMLITPAHEYGELGLMELPCGYGEPAQFAVQVEEFLAA